MKLQNRFIVWLAQWTPSQVWFCAVVMAGYTFCWSLWASHINHELAQLRNANDELLTNGIRVIPYSPGKEVQP